ncbi:MAG: pilus assembly protein PilM [Bacteriovoracaceae bacterium]|nr:pilus assembly protein PilM [Bacteriovoracaceae bacterium]
MNILSIDTGSYSVKFLEFRHERRHLILDHMQEIILSEVKDEFDDELSTEELQEQIIKAYLKDLQFSGKIISHIPRKLLTNRFINIPINNRKKAEMMVPHQLDGNLPYPISKAHYTSDLYKTGTTYFAIVNVAQTESFNELYNGLTRDKILPTHMFSEMSAVLAYSWEHKIKGPVCLIDIGHTTSNAYFIHDGKIVATHTSYLAGDNITETIAETYQIQKEDAVKYKHEKCFFLTTQQLEGVSDAQKEFATIMKQVMSPLISDFKRWELGFRVKHAIPLEKIFIFGGTSNIENIDNFLTQALGVNVEKLGDIYSPKDNAPMSECEKSTYAMGSLLALTQVWKRQPSNFLRGAYLSTFSDTITLHSSAFLASRTLLISLILSIGLIANYINASSSEAKLTKKIAKMLKSPSLELSPREVRSFKKRPVAILRKLKRKERGMISSIKALKNSSGNNAVLPLAELSKIVGRNEKVDLTSFNYESNLIVASFAADASEELVDLKKQLKQSGLTGVKINHKEGSKELSLEFRD